MQLERNLWPLLAVRLHNHQDYFHRLDQRAFCQLNGDLIDRSQHEGDQVQQVEAQVKCCSFAVDMLTKCVHLSGDEMRRHLAEVFGTMDLNHENIIQANFILVA